MGRAYACEDRSEPLVGASLRAQGSPATVKTISEGVGEARQAGRLWAEEACGTVVEQMSKALHDLCQPLTVLQCRLEIGGLAGTPESYREAVSLGLVECARLMDAVESMRDIVTAATCNVTDTELRNEQ
jgi:hypothetical protein